MLVASQPAPRIPDSGLSCIPWQARKILTNPSGFRILKLNACVKVLHGAAEAGGIAVRQRAVLTKMLKGWQGAIHSPCCDVISDVSLAFEAVTSELEPREPKSASKPRRSRVIPSASLLAAQLAIRFAMSVKASSAALPSCLFSRSGNAICSLSFSCACETSGVLAEEDQPRQPTSIRSFAIGLRKPAAWTSPSYCPPNAMPGSSRTSASLENAAVCSFECIVS